MGVFIRGLSFVFAIVPACALTLAELAKILDPAPALIFMRTGFDIPISVGTWLIGGLALIEVAGGLLLAYLNGRRVWPAVPCLMMVGLFTGMVYAVHLRNPHVAIDCGCFGALQAPLGGESILSHLKLNAALIACLATYVLLFSLGRVRSGRHKQASVDTLHGDRVPGPARSA